jgi:prepilin-type N-terminal cleavage/methylation domain-containing protein
MILKKQFFGFTLIELMTAVAIVIVLATVGYLSYTDYLKWVRDTSRSSQMVSLYDGLQLYSSKWRVPLPDNSIEIRANEQECLIF